MLANMQRRTVIRAPRRATPTLSCFSSSRCSFSTKSAHTSAKQTASPNTPVVNQSKEKSPSSLDSRTDTSVSKQRTATETQSSLPSSTEPISNPQLASLHGAGTTTKSSPLPPVESLQSPTPKREVTTIKTLRGVRINPEERQWHATVVHGRGVLEPYRHPRTHGVPVASIQFRAHLPAPIQLAAHFASHAAASLGIPISGVASLPTQRTLWTVPRGPFAHKKSQENFERRVHARAIKAFDADAEVVDRWVRYLEAHALPGVGMRVVRWHRLPVGIGRSHLQSVVGRMRLGRPTNKQKVKELGEKIVEVESQATMESEASAKSS
ncbi:mitochondrial 37S ribosomal protein rsm10 [Lactarius tabidus]